MGDGMGSGLMAAKPTLTTTTTTAIDLKPVQRKKLQNALALHETLENDIEVLQIELADQKATIERIREESGAKSFEFEGSQVTRVEGVSSSFSKKYCVDQGWLTNAQVEEATITKPKKAYTLISTSGRRKHQRGDE